MDFVEDFPFAEWQATRLIIPKPGSKAKYRMTVDHRRVNAASIRESWSILHLESELHEFHGSSCFASFNSVSGYLQLPLHPESF